jgi:hypothetical protein
MERQLNVVSQDVGALVLPAAVVASIGGIG